MIQEYLMDILKEKTSNFVPKITWTVDNYYENSKHTGTIYSTGGFKPDEYDTEYRFPTYQVLVRSKDWDYAKLIADTVFNALHKYPRTPKEKQDSLNVETSFSVGNKTEYVVLYEVFLITSASEPLRVGVNNGIMEYSLNFTVTLTELERLKIEYGFFNANQVYKIRGK